MISYLERKQPGRAPDPVRRARRRRWDSSCRPSRSDLSSGWSWSTWRREAHSLSFAPDSTGNVSIHIRSDQTVNIYSNHMFNTLARSLTLTCPTLRARWRPYWQARRRRRGATRRSHGNRNHIQGPACTARTVWKSNGDIGYNVTELYQSKVVFFVWVWAPTTHFAQCRVGAAVVCFSHTMALRQKAAPPPPPPIKTLIETCLITQIKLMYGPFPSYRNWFVKIILHHHVFVLSYPSVMSLFIKSTSHHVPQSVMWLADHT